MVEEFNARAEWLPFSPLLRDERESGSLSRFSDQTFSA